MINKNICVKTLSNLFCRGVFRYANCYPDAISMIASGKMNVRSLITHRFPLKESNKAFETAKNFAKDSVNSSGAIKVMIKCNEH